MPPHTPVRPPPSDVPLRRSRRIPRSIFDLNDTYGQRWPVEIKRAITEYIEEDGPFLMVNEIRANEMSAHFIKALLSIGTLVFDVPRQYEDIFKHSER